MDIAWLTVLFVQQLHRVHQQTLDIQEESHQCQVLIQSLLRADVHNLSPYEKRFHLFLLSDY